LKTTPITPTKSPAGKKLSIANKESKGALSPFALQKTRRGRILRSNTTNCSKAYGEGETIEITDGGKHGETIGGGKSQEWFVLAQWLASVNNL